MRYRELVVVRVKLFSLVFVRTHRLASRGREAGAIARKREWREEKKRRGAEKRIKVEEQEKGRRGRGRRGRRRKIGRSTILLVRRRASKQNAWSTSELFPFPVTLASPFRPALSLRLPGRCKLLPVAGAFFLFLRSKCFCSGGSGVVPFLPHSRISTA